MISLDIGQGSEGNRKRRTLYGKTKKEVQVKLARLKSDSLLGISLEPQNIKIHDFLERYLRDVARPAITPKTYIGYEGTVRNHINPYIGGLKLTKITPLQIQALYTQLEDDGRSPHIRRQVNAFLHQAFKKAEEWQIIIRNPCSAVVKPKVSKAKMRILTPEQVNAFLTVAREHRLYALFVLAVTTGMRQGELFGLEWWHIDFKSWSISVQQSIQEVKGELIVGEPKTSSSKRSISISEVDVAALKEHRKRLLAEGNIGSQFLFCDTIGGPLRRSNFIRKSFKPLLKKADVPDIRFHDLRHTSASLLIGQGINAKVIQERLGHSSITVTMDTYGHLLPNLQAEAAEKINSAITIGSSKIGDES